MENKTIEENFRKTNNILNVIFDLTEEGIGTGEDKYFSLASRLLRFLKSETGQDFESMTDYLYSNWEDCT